MKRLAFLFFIFLTLIITSANSPLRAERPDYGDARHIKLPAPDKSGGIPLMQALGQRHSNRNINQAEDLSLQEISNLLWAAWGVNRADGKHTAPSAKNQQEVAIYLAMKSGVWYYDSAKHELQLALDQDITAKLGGAPQTLIYSALTTEPCSPMHIGSIYQNVGLYCASAGLANVVKVTGASALDDILPLAKDYTVYTIHPVGKPN